jgi:hypothetical protein
MDDARLPIRLTDGKTVYVSDLWAWPHAIVSGSERRFLIFEEEVNRSLKANGIEGVSFVDATKNGYEETLRKLKDEMERRYKVIFKEGLYDIWMHNASHRPDVMPPTIVFVHDSDLIAGYGEAYNNAVILLQKGRGAGFHVFVHQKSTSKKRIMQPLKANLSVRIYLENREMEIDTEGHSEFEKCNGFPIAEEEFLSFRKLFLAMEKNKP